MYEELFPVTEVVLFHQKVELAGVDTKRRTAADVRPQASQTVSTELSKSEEDVGVPSRRVAKDAHEVLLRDTVLSPDARCRVVVAGELAV